MHYCTSEACLTPPPLQSTTSQSNAAVGLPAADLSGGCICCSKQGALHEALASIRASYSRPDYLVRELLSLVPVSSSAA